MKENCIIYGEDTPIDNSSREGRDKFHVPVRTLGQLFIADSAAADIFHVAGDVVA